MKLISLASERFNYYHICCFLVCNPIVYSNFNNNPHIESIVQTFLNVVSYITTKGG